MPSWPTICCMRLSVRSLSVSANFTTRLEEAPCGGRKRQGEEEGDGQTRGPPRPPRGHPRLKGGQLCHEECSEFGVTAEADQLGQLRDLSCHPGLRTVRLGVGPWGKILTGESRVGIAARNKAPYIQDQTCCWSSKCRCGNLCPLSHSISSEHLIHKQCHPTLRPPAHPHSLWTQSGLQQLPCDPKRNIPAL